MRTLIFALLFHVPSVLWANDTINVISEDARGVPATLEKTCGSTAEYNASASFLNVIYIDAPNSAYPVFNLGIEKTLSLRCAGCGDEYRLYFLEMNKKTGQAEFKSRTIKMKREGGRLISQWIGSDNRPSEFNASVVPDQGQFTKLGKGASNLKLICDGFLKARNDPDYTKFLAKEVSAGQPAAPAAAPSGTTRGTGRQ